MKKIFFFAAAIAAVALVSCADDLSDGCTCSSTIAGITTTTSYTPEQLEGLDVIDCTELGESLSIGKIKITCE